MEKLSEQFARYVAAQVDAGADAIQVFDSWVGALSPADYEEFVAPHSARILAAVDAPTIHFGTGATEELLRALARAGGDVIGLDWRVPLELGWERRGQRGAGQPRSRRCSSAPGSASRRRRSTCSSARAAGAATSSTSATACCRRPIPVCSTQLAALVQERTVSARV